MKSLTGRKQKFHFWNNFPQISQTTIWKQNHQILRSSIKTKWEALNSTFLFGTDVGSDFIS